MYEDLKNTCIEDPNYQTINNRAAKALWDLASQIRKSSREVKSHAVWFTHRKLTQDPTLDPHNTLRVALHTAQANVDSQLPPAPVTQTEYLDFYHTVESTIEDLEIPDRIEANILTIWRESDPQWKPFLDHLLQRLGIDPVDQSIKPPKCKSNAAVLAIALGYVETKWKAQ